MSLFWDLKVRRWKGCTLVTKAFIRFLSSRREARDGTLESPAALPPPLRCRSLGSKEPLLSDEAPFLSDEAALAA